MGLCVYLALYIISYVQYLPPLRRQFLWKGFLLLLYWNSHPTNPPPFYSLLNEMSPSFLNFVTSKMLCTSVPSHFSCVQLFETLWTVDRQAPLSMGSLQARKVQRVPMPSSRESFWPKDWTWVSCIAGWFFNAEPMGKSSKTIHKCYYIEYVTFSD